MSVNPALTALENPAGFAKAAQARLGESAVALQQAAANAGAYAALLSQLSALSSKAGTLMPGMIAGTASDADLGSLSNAERVAQASEALLCELARRSTRKTQIDAMRWAALARALWADLRLPRREIAPTAFLGVDWERALAQSSIRILPGAEPALAALTRDPLQFGAGWALDDLAADLADFVVTT